MIRCLPAPTASCFSLSATSHSATHSKTLNIRALEFRKMSGGKAVYIRVYGGGLGSNALMQNFIFKAGLK